MRRGPLLWGATVLLCLGIASPAAAVAPTVTAQWVSQVQLTNARVNAEVNPNGKPSSYHLDYIPRAAYEANLAGAKDPFAGAARLPASGETGISGTAPTTVSPLLFPLSVDTAYRYRLVLKNADGTTVAATRDFATYPTTAFSLAEGRGWELVSPVEKNGGQVEPPGALAGGGVLAGAADGSSITYGSKSSFAGGVGSAAANQYISSRSATGWSTQNITTPAFSASYGSGPTGVPYQLFSPDLGRGLLLNGRPCRGQATGCPVANPPLPGTDAPPGYQNYYLRQGGSFEALLGAAELAHTDLDPAEFELRFVGASPDLSHTVLASCAALTATATEVPLGAGCDPAAQNLYRHSAAALTLINSTPGATLATGPGAVSADGARVYFNDATGALFLREGALVKALDDDAPGVGAATLQSASADGAVALYLKAAHLYRYSAATDTSTDLTPSGGVAGVLGASADLTTVYFRDAEGLKRRAGAVTTKIAAAADAANYPPATGTARVAADGTKLAFISTTPLTTADGLTYDNTDLNTKAPDSQIYLYDSVGAGALRCVSCNPTGARPLGPSTIPGAIANGTVPGSTHTYKPRVLSASGGRVFFDSKDALVLSDVNLSTDVYQWLAPGAGGCARPAGCVALVSAGLTGAAGFIDASASGADAFFHTERSLVGADTGAVDVYDARIGGGFPEPTEPVPCVGDACQLVPPAVEDPVLTTVLAGPGNPAERYRTYGAKARCPKGKVRKKGKCVAKKAAKKGKAGKAKGGRRR